jgi:arginine repressor
MQATVSEWLNELEAQKFPKREDVVLLHSDVEDLQGRGILPSTETQLRFRLRQMMGTR